MVLYSHNPATGHLIFWQWDQLGLSWKLFFGSETLLGVESLLLNRCNFFISSFLCVNIFINNYNNSGIVKDTIIQKVSGWT